MTRQTLSLLFLLVAMVCATTGQLISLQEFRKTFEACSLAIPHDFESKHKGLIHSTPKARISTRDELAMFLANIYHESAGLQHRRELNPQPASFYEGGLAFIGRGYIQLTHNYNYRDASRYLFGDDRLVWDPEQVASNEDIAWLTAAWFWSARVQPVSDFESTIRKINSRELAPGAGPVELAQAARRRRYHDAIRSVLQGGDQGGNPSQPGQGVIVHVVQSGESLYTIGQRYGVSHEKIARDNGIWDPTSLQVGQKLNIIRDGQQSGNGGGSQPGSGHGGIVHVVQAGETLYTIGQRYGVPHDKIARDNGIWDPSALQIGQKLKIIA